MTATGHPQQILVKCHLIVVAMEQLVVAEAGGDDTV